MAIVGCGKAVVSVVAEEGGQPVCIHPAQIHTLPPNGTDHVGRVARQGDAAHMEPLGLIAFRCKGGMHSARALIKVNARALSYEIDQYRHRGRSRN